MEKRLTAAVARVENIENDCHRRESAFEGAVAFPNFALFQNFLGFGSHGGHLSRTDQKCQVSGAFLKDVNAAMIRNQKEREEQGDATEAEAENDPYVERLRADIAAKMAELEM